MRKTYSFALSMITWAWFAYALSDVSHYSFWLVYSLVLLGTIVYNFVRTYSKQ